MGIRKSGLDLWPHQERGLDETWDLIDSGESRICTTGPCGSGKTAMAIEMILEALDRGLKVIFYVHRSSLAEQTRKTFEAAGISVGMRASGYQQDLNLPVQISMVQTEKARTLCTPPKWPIHHADIVLIDEVHGIKSATAQALIDLHIAEGASIVGLTATPLNIWHMLEKLVVAGKNSEMRGCGAHLWCREYCPTMPDMLRVKRNSKGEYSESDADKQMHVPTIFGHVIKHYARLNPHGKPTLLFGPSVASAKYFCDAFNAVGIRSAHIDGKEIYYGSMNSGGSQTLDSRSISNREELFDKVRRGEIQVLTNRYVMVEGIDLPQVGHLIFATPFGSVTQFLQAGGRLLRNHPTLKDVCLQDHGGCLSMDTEVLTPDGWVGPEGISGCRQVAAFDPKTGAISWEGIQDHHIRTVSPDETMYFAAGRQTDIEITGNHKLVSKRRMGPGNWPPEWSLDRVDYQNAKRGRVRIPVSGTQDFPGIGLKDCELEFIGWWVTDGTFNSERSLSISQSEHQPHIRDLRACLISCGFDYTEYENKPPKKFPSLDGCPVRASSKSIRFHIPKGTCKSRPRNGWWKYREYLKKDLPASLDQMTIRQFSVFLHAIHLGDGAKDRKPGSYRICTGNHSFADNLQSMCVRRGYKCNISQDKKKPNKMVLNIQNHGFTFIQSDGKDNGQCRWSLRSPLSGEQVWCLSNRLKTIVTRRNGKVAILGNSFWQHGSLNEDRDWEIGKGAKQVRDERVKRVQDGDAEEGIVCGKCGAMRLSGPQCFECGHKHVRSVLNVQQTDGSLKQVRGPYIKRKYRPANAIKAWNSMYYPSSKSKSSRPSTFHQLAARFKKQHPEYHLHKSVDSGGQSRLAVVDSGKIIMLPNCPAASDVFLMSQAVKDVEKRDLFR